MCIRGKLIRSISPITCPESCWVEPCPSSNTAKLFICLAGPLMLGHHGGFEYLVVGAGACCKFQRDFETHLSSSVIGRALWPCPWI